MDYSTKLEPLNIGNTLIDVLSLGLGVGIGVLCGLLLMFAFLTRAKTQRLGLVEREKMNLEAIHKQGEELRLVHEKLEKANEERVRNQAESHAIKNQLEDFRKNSKELETRFENLANKIFDEKTAKFKTQSSESINDLLSPLKEKLKDFEKKVDDSFSSQKAEQFSLKEQIGMFVESSNQMKAQTENLTNALKGDNKAQGAWGEIILEKILESTGLKKDINYSIQATGMGLKHVETGAHLKPDVIVNLPEDKHIIIDSKVSLTAYERFCSSDDDAVRGVELKKFLTSVKAKVNELEQRRYQDTEKLGTPDFVIMFMPVEGAYMLALQSDQNLHQYAWDKGVVLSGPATLYSTLRTVASLWLLVNQNNNSKEIVKRGNALYDKIVGFVGDMQKIGANLKTIENNYDKAMVKLSGKGSILTQTENMKSLGLTTSKSIPSEMLDTISGDVKNEDKIKDEAA